MRNKAGLFLTIESCESRSLMHFVPLLRSVIASVGGFEMLYLTVFQLFRWISVNWNTLTVNS